MTLNEEAIWQALQEIHDPEIPAISIVDLGIVRNVAVEDESVCVTITPTFASCPAHDVIRRQIREKLTTRGFNGARVETVLSPPWSTDWITERGRANLQSAGLAPPCHHAGDVEAAFDEPLACPYCRSTHTGATALVRFDAMPSHVLLPGMQPAL